MLYPVILIANLFVHLITNYFIIENLSSLFYYLIIHNMYATMTVTMSPYQYLFAIFNERRKYYMIEMAILFPMDEPDGWLLLVYG